MTSLEKTAKFVRVITVPPVLVCLLLIILYFTNSGVFTDITQLLISVFLLVIVPLLSYPLSNIIPSYKREGRDGQRKLAFIFNFFGYAAAVIYGFLASITHGLLLINLTYFISVCILIIFNKMLKIRASGHACSITGPIILTIYFIGWKCVLPCTILFALIIWSSLILKRHTPKDLTWGSLTAIIAFGIGLLLILI